MNVCPDLLCICLRRIFLFQRVLTFLKVKLRYSQLSSFPFAKHLETLISNCFNDSIID